MNIKEERLENSMPRRVLASLLLCLWITGLMAGGCTYRRSPQQDLLKAYRQKMEVQKAALEKENEKQGLASELDAEGYERLGDRYLKQGNKDLAFIQYDKALRMDTSRIHLRYRLGRLFLEKDLPEEAQKEFQEMLKAIPNNALPYEGMGRVLFKSGHYSEAEKNFKQALKHEPDFWQVHHFLGIIYDRWQEFDKAADEYRTAIALKPDSFMLHHNLGVSRFLKGDYEQAVTAFRQSLSLEHSNKNALNHLALALSKLGRYKEAFETLKKGSDEASAYYNLGCIYMAEGKYEEAVEAFERAVDTKPIFYAAAQRSLARARATATVLLNIEAAEKMEDNRQKEESSHE